MKRREFLSGISGAALTSCLPRFARRPLESGVQSGDVDANSAVVWSRAPQPGLMEVEWSLSPRFDRAMRSVGRRVDASSDLCGKVRLTGLPSGQRIHYRAWFDDSEQLPGSFRTAPSPTDASDVLLAWSGDVNGQGWGIDPARGGMPAFTALRERQPSLFLHCGDAIYADDKLPPSLLLPDGTEWKNIVDPARERARTLDEFRVAWRYARRSKEVRAASAEIPIAAIWDDHEVRNDWFPGQNRDGLVVESLVPFARQAMFEHLPTLRSPNEPMYRTFAWGPLVDVFMLDGRSHRAPNYPPVPGGLLGDEQANWLVSALERSTAVWKIVVNGQPIGEVVAGFDAWGGTTRRPELARVLAQTRGVTNVIWLSADVHYAAARRFDPRRATLSSDFAPFWEFVAGPMHAATFPLNPPDDAFGPEVEWCSAGPTFSGTPANGEQFFGLLAIDGKTHTLTVAFVDARGRDVHKVAIPAV